jgi:hypothetical protein
MAEPAVPNWNELQIDLKTLKVAADEVDQTAEFIRGLRIQIDTHRVQLLAGWDSESSRLFSGVIIQWLNDFDMILKELNQIHVGLIQSNIQYESDEQDRLLAVQRLASIAAKINY